MHVWMCMKKAALHFSQDNKSQGECVVACQRQFVAKPADIKQSGGTCFRTVFYFLHSIFHLI